jgi:hypothetical protein
MRGRAMYPPINSVPSPKGIAFEIEDLTNLREWASAHRLRMVVELDHKIEDDEYEEVLAFYEQGMGLRRWTMWRAHDQFVLESMNGPALHAGRVSDLMAELSPLDP